MAAASNSVGAPAVNVLLVDDQAANILALAEVLRPLDLNLVTCQSGQEALRHLLDREFALILLDVKMPDLSGIETARLIRQRDKTRDIPIIFMTAYDRDDQQAIQGYTLGAVDFLTKPIVPEILRAKVSVFVDLFRKAEQIRRQSSLLRETQLKENQALLAQERQRWEMERLRDEAAKEKKTTERLTEIVAERTRAELLMRQRAHQHGLIAAFGHKALSGAGLDALFREVVLGTAQSLDVDFCVILEALPDQTLQLRAGVGWNEEQHDHGPVAGWSDPEALYALKLDQSVVVADLRNERRFDGAPLLRHGVVSGMTVLIRQQERPFGVMTAHSRRPRVFTQDDVNFLQAVANVLAAAIERRRGEQELSAVKDQLAVQLADMTRLHKLSGRLHSSIDPHALAAEVLPAVTELQETTMGILLLDHPEESGCYSLVSIGLSERPREPVRGQAQSNGPPPLTLADVLTDPRFTPYGPALRQAGCRGMHTTPLRTRGGRTIGSVVAFFAHERPPSENQLRLVELYVRQAAEAIDNARLYQEIQEANCRKDQFLAMLAHELRNPLAPLRNALEILRLKENDPDVRERARELAERQVHHMSRLVDDLLDVSRISRGKIQLSLQAVQLAPLIDRAVESTRLLFEARGVALEVPAAAEPVWLNADPTRLEQILINLLNNAAKYTPSGGRVWLGAEPEADTVTIRVRDNGIGIAPELLPRVFDMFVQAEGSLDRSQGGLGIGLTLVHTLVTLHGGQIEAHSAGLDQGSEFVIALPRLREPPVMPQAAETITNGHQAACRILVVDDNVDAAESLAFLLRTEGHEVVTAYNGPAALEVARQALPDVVLLDIGLPGMNGHEVACRLRQEHPQRDLGLVALTGYGQEDDRRRSQEAGIDAHLTKPVDLAELQAILRRRTEKPEPCHQGA